MDDPEMAEVDHILHTVFGHQEFRSNMQRQAVQAVLKGWFCHFWARSNFKIMTFRGPNSTKF